MGDCILNRNKMIPNTLTYTASSRGSGLDMGEYNLYRYINTNSVPNSNSDTYKATSRNTSIDMGSTNTYRYVNTDGVPNIWAAYSTWSSGASTQANTSFTKKSGFVTANSSGWLIPYTGTYHWVAATVGANEGFSFYVNVGGSRKYTGGVAALHNGNLSCTAGQYLYARFYASVAGGQTLLFTAGLIK